MLPIENRPPGFTLPGADGHYIGSASFYGHKRVVLLFVPKAHEAQGQAYVEAVERDAAQFADRDLVVFIIAAPGALADARSTPPVTILHDTREKAAVLYGVDLDAIAFYLIGKDGTIKMARHDIPSDGELFAVIDAMPMRRQEMRRRKT